MGASDELNLQISGQIVPLRCIAHHHKAIDPPPANVIFEHSPKLEPSSRLGTSLALVKTCRSSLQVRGTTICNG